MERTLSPAGYEVLHALVLGLRLEWQTDGWLFVGNSAATGRSGVASALVDNLANGGLIEVSEGTAAITRSGRDSVRVARENAFAVAFRCLGKLP